MNIILLLAGLSRRCGDKNKLLEYYNGSKLFTYPLSLALSFCDTIAVTGHESDLFKKEILSYYRTINSSSKLEVIFNPHYKDGQFTSLCSGLRSLKDGEDFAVFLGDMPKITFDFVSKLFSRFQELKNECDILRPFDGDKPFHPVVFTSRCRDIILKHEGESGVETKSVIEKEKLKVIPFFSQYSSCAFDIDYLEDFRL